MKKIATEIWTNTTPHPDQPSADRLAGMCKALGHPARISILKQLLQEDRCVCGRIVDILPLAQSTVSQHLKVMKEAGLIIGEVDGPKTCYCVDREQLAWLAKTIAAFLPEFNLDNL